MQAILNYYKNSDGYCFVRESLSNPNDYAISIIWQHDLVHVKLHKKVVRLLMFLMFDRDFYFRTIILTITKIDFIIMTVSNMLLITS